MQKIVLISAILAYTAAAPALLIEDHEIHYPLVSKTSNLIESTYIHPVPVLHEISSKKSTLTKSSQVVNHGGTAVLHAPVYSEYHPVTYSQVVPSKTTVTKSNQVVNHGSTNLVHAPIYAEYHPVMYSQVVPSKTTVTKSNQVVNHGGTEVVHAPVVSSPVYYHSTPVLSVKTGDSATSHHSSTVHETVPVVNHLPLYALHH